MEEGGTCQLMPQNPVSCCLPRDKLGDLGLQIEFAI